MAAASRTRPASLPRLRRDLAHGPLGGVCAGLGQRLGVDPLVPRVAFVAAAVAGGVGIVLYALAWALVPVADSEAGPQTVRPAGSWRVAAGIALLALSALLVFRELGVWLTDALVWPVVLAAAGAALIWRQSSVAVAPEVPSAEGRPAAPRRSTPTASAETSAAAPGRRSRLRAAAFGRTGLGVALVVAAALVFLVANGALGALADVLLGAAVVAVVLALILLPWWWRLARSLASERAERIRSQERAEVAAHLHDSVLQTLALVQRRAEDPREVASLARRQERELRAWLSDRAPARPSERVAAALEAAAEEVEAAHRATVEAVVRGDAVLDERGQTVVAAAREALVNAAKFAGPEPVSLYAELGEERLHVFVRDRGPGFDPAAVPADRRGVRDSIVGRMERRGGTALLHTRAHAPGTEVELLMERRNGR